MLVWNEEEGVEFYVFTMMSSECQPREQICNKIQNEGQIYLMGFHFCPWKYYLFLGYAFSFPLLKYKSNLLISNFISKCDWMGYFYFKIAFFVFNLSKCIRSTLNFSEHNSSSILKLCSKNSCFPPFCP